MTDWAKEKDKVISGIIESLPETGGKASLKELIANQSLESGFSNARVLEFVRNLAEGGYLVFDKPLNTVCLTAKGVEVRRDVLRKGRK